MIRVDVPFGQFEADAWRIGVTRLPVVDGQRDAGRIRVLGGDRLAQIGRERGDAALARQVVADESDAIDVSIGLFHVDALLPMIPTDEKRRNPTGTASARLGNCDRVWLLKRGVG